MTEPHDPVRRFWTVDEFSAISGLPQSTIRGWLASGVLPATRLGIVGKRGKVLIPRQAAEEMLDRCTSGGRAG